MKSVTLSQVVRAHDSYRFLCPIQSWGQFTSLACALVPGLALIAMLFMALDPTAPLAYIVIPVIAGGLLPVFAALPARFEVNTRFHAQHFAAPLDETIQSMGYAPDVTSAGATRCYNRHGYLLRWKENQITVTVREHAISIRGPVFALRLLQQKLIG